MLGAMRRPLRSFAAIGVVGAATGVVAPSCSSDDAPIPELAKPCVINSDCKDPLLCVFGKCHRACNESRDCARDERCTRVESGSICQFAEEKKCAMTCTAPLRCSVDAQCRYPCEQSSECLPTQVCISHVCADLPEVPDSATVLPPLNPNGGWDGHTETPGGKPDAEVDAAGMDASEPDGGVIEDGSLGEDRGPVGTPDSSRNDVATSDRSTTQDAGAPDKGAVDGSGSTCPEAGIASFGFRPSNLPDPLPLPPAFNLKDIVLQNCTFDTDAMTGDYAPCKDTPTAVVDLSDGRKAAVLFAQNVTIQADKPLGIVGEKPFILVATGNVEINGKITAAPSKTSGWYAGGAPASASASHAGICPVTGGGGGGGVGNHAAANGAGGGGFCGVGGSGSAHPAGGASGPGGSPYGTPELVPLVGGSSGGNTEAVPNAGWGYGGGAVQVVAGSSILIGVRGVINMGGGGGDQTCAGGGSGGAILLEAPNVTVRGTLAANGGGGGTWNLKRGSHANASAEPALGAVDGVAHGGNGAAGDSLNGQDGTNGPLGSPPYAAGGGGAVGRIRINTGCGGALTLVQGEATVSPSDATGCFTTGTLPSIATSRLTRASLRP